MGRASTLIGVGYLLLCLAALAASALLGSVGYAPFPIALGPPPEPVVVTVWHGTEKREWLEDAVARFEATSPRVGRRPIRVVLRGLGSVEQVERVAAQNWRGETPPTALMPASSVWLDVLAQRWQAGGSRGAIVAQGADAPRSVVLSPIVLVIWEERAQVLWPDAPGELWDELREALALPGWQQVAEQRGFAAGTRQHQAAAQWGPVKLAHTSPLRSNSGALALLLLAYDFYGKAAGLTPDDVQGQEFVSLVGDLESAVPQFGASTGALMDDMVRAGPGAYDVAIVYESAAIARLDAAERAWGGLRVYYPPVTAMSDHPFAILDAPWATPEQREAARQLRDFLLTRPIQELALQRYGFRPADAGIPVSAGVAGSPFNVYAPQGVRAELPPLAEAPSAATLASLLDMWRSQVGR